MPEVAGGAALLANPLSPTEICKYLSQISSDENLRKELIQKGFENAKRYSWDGAVRNIIEELEYNVKI